MSRFWTNTTPINVTNLNKMIDMMYPVGSYYETSDDTFNPNTFWGGTWELETDGTTLVSKSSTNGSKFNVDTATVVGSETHTLTIDEMPKHRDEFEMWRGAGDMNYGGVIGVAKVDGVMVGTGKCLAHGGDMPHNNIQPSKVVNRWHRTA